MSSYLFVRLFVCWPSVQNSSLIICKHSIFATSLKDSINTSEVNKLFLAACFLFSAVNT